MVYEQAIINEVQRHPCIYNKSDKFYNDFRAKEIAWKQIANVTKTSPADCKRTWSVLRDSLRRVLKKRLTSQDDVSFRKVWKYEEEMSFLIPYINTKPSIVNLVVSGSEGEEEDSSNGLASEQHIVPDEIMMNANQSSRQIPEMIPVTKPDQDDDIDAFFKSIAATVKKFPLKRRIITKTKIFNLVTQYEMEYCRRLETQRENHNPFGEDENLSSSFTHSALWSDIKVEEM